MNKSTQTKIVPKVVNALKVLSTTRLSNITVSKSNKKNNVLTLSAAEYLSISINNKYSPTKTTAPIPMTVKSYYIYMYYLSLYKDKFDLINRKLILNFL